MTHYYNENDPQAVAILKQLIADGVLPAGDVDDRSIEDVEPYELYGYTQCHFFAGVGGWAYALRLAGWPDDLQVWTGSCPCQPFSQAGKGDGFDDERHLWPAWYWLIQQLRPANVLGEQVASKDANPWIDLVHADMEALGHAFGCVAFPAAGIGAPHIRDRTYWVAHADSTVTEQLARARSVSDQTQGPGAYSESDRPGIAVGLADGAGTGLAQREQLAGIRAGTIRAPARQSAVGGSDARRLADLDFDRRLAASFRELHDIQHHIESRSGAERLADTVGGQHFASGTRTNQRTLARGYDAVFAQSRPAGPTNGFWRDADWLGCRDGKWRPVEPDTFPLAHGVSGRVGRLRGYGNAIVPQAAAEFIQAFIFAKAMRQML